MGAITWSRKDRDEDTVYKQICQWLYKNRISKQKFSNLWSVSITPIENVHKEVNLPSLKIKCKWFWHNDWWSTILWELRRNKMDDK